MRKIELNKCEICERNTDKLFCDNCVKRYHINKDKKCSQCRFYKENKCVAITQENDKINKNYFCLYFINKNK